MSLRKYPQWGCWVARDASETGFGGYVVEHGSCGQWTPAETGLSSTWRELSAVWFVLSSVAEKLANYRVRWFTDNVRILRVGSKKACCCNEGF